MIYLFVMIHRQGGDDCYDFQVGVKAIIAAECFKTQNYYGMLRDICPELDTAVPGDLRAEK